MARSPLLLIDDDDLSREVLAFLFSEDGFAVTAFASGDLALARLAEQQDVTQWAAILTDMQMPGTSGAALALRLREVVGRDTPVIAMSGSAAEQAELKGFDGFLLKPLTAADLRALLASKPERAARAEKASMQAPGTAGVVADAVLPAPVLDEKTFDEFAALLGPGPMQEFVRACVDDVTRHQRNIGKALETGDQAALHRAAHTMKGSVGMLGARELQALAARLEGDERDPAYQRATLAEILEAAHRLRRMLRGRGFQLAGDDGASEDKDTIP